MKILNHYIPIQVLLLALTDFVLSFGVFFLTSLVVGESDGQGTSWDVAAGSLLFAVLIAAGMAAVGLYSSKQRYRIEGVLARMFIAFCLAATGVAVLDFVLTFVESAFVWVVAFAVSLFVLGVSRFVQFRFMDDEIFRRRIVVYGAGKRASRILELRRASDQRGFRVVGFIPASSDEMVMEDERVISAFDGQLIDYVKQHTVDEVVVAIDDRRKGFPISELLECKLQGVRVVDLLEFLERESGRVKVDLMSPSWLIFSESFNRRNRNRISFRILDLAISGIVFLVAWPVMIIVALAILFDDGLPVLYRQQRVGFNGREFTLLKFRSMRKDAESLGAPVWAKAQDPRVTRVGGVLRRFRLDELPQLFNVIRGDMSLVGPRPERPEFVTDLANRIPYYHERHYVKPGLTGWAQLCYPYGASEKDALAKLEYDMYYVKNRSLVFYLIILVQTAEVILWQKGSR